ncbi:MAG: pyruvate/2-oxoglutarate dehydrogenase complex dihydrolipoamide acyltransferase (E2) component [Saprospiraceae bacterium]|jgi:pyruvate/2-oxoglutarate dehydrogenase complex dihydrolipoamide acyltransferase (E2) component
MKYQVKEWPSYRDDIIDFLSLSKERNPIVGVFEVDITKASSLFAQQEEKSNSIMAYLLWCIGQAVKAHPEVHAMKKGKEVITFEDVDISMMIEKDSDKNQKMPVPYIFRKIQNKSYQEVNKELQDAKSKDFSTLSKRRKKSKLYKILPRFIRLALLKKVLSDPFKSKKALGTIALTSLGMFVKNRKFWPIPVVPYSCGIAAGSIYTSQEGDQIKKIMCVTVTVDHNIVDGGPASRFTQTLFDILEKAEGL